MLVVAGVVCAILFVTERSLQQSYEQFYRQQFETESQFFIVQQDARLGALKEQCRSLAKSVRLRAAMEIVQKERDDDALSVLYGTAQHEVFNKAAPGGGPVPDSFLRFLDGKGEVMAPPKVEAVWAGDADNAQLEKLGRALASFESQEIAVFPRLAGSSRGLDELLVTKIIDPETKEVFGAFVLGMPLIAKGRPGKTAVKTGIWIDNAIHSESIPRQFGPIFARELNQVTAGSRLKKEVAFSQGGEPYLAFFRDLQSNPNFPKAWQISLFSLAEAEARKSEARRNILLLGATGLFVALVLSTLLSHGLTGPIQELVRGTGEIQRGNYEVVVPVRARDEIGRLARSFNEMALGLALRDKYRSLLNLVADKQVAEDLINGKIALGGELREVSVLFCDIRGFTALTQHMEPKEVIQMLNEHFTPLTDVVYQHNGVVDKFVGDLIMAIFGAPKSFGNDPANAVKCAWDMIEKRRQLNGASTHRIQIGIGVATGNVVAGRMGSQDRLNYTVLGERVNLASRLCGQAAPMDIVIDQTTWERTLSVIEATPLPPVLLKGFSEKVPIYKLVGLKTDPAMIPAAG